MEIMLAKAGEPGRPTEVCITFGQKETRVFRNFRVG